MSCLRELDNELLKEMREYYKGTKIPNPEHYPLKFKYMVEMFKNFKRNQMTSLSKKI